MPIPTNLLALPLVRMSVETGTNEDWIDSLKFLVDTGVPDDEKPQLDLRDIAFEMEVRRSAPDNQVVISASTENGSLAIGEPPDYGYLIINVDHEEMKIQQPGIYAADIVGIDETSRRVVVQIDLSIIAGITRP
jgi:hypothetical protein